MLRIDRPDWTETLNIASFNILHGRSLVDGQVDNRRLAEACASLDADVLCLQEVDRGQSRSHGADQTAEVASAMAAAHWRFEPAIVGEPGAKWRAAGDSDSSDSDEPGYGVAMVSRLKVREWHTIRLAAARVRAPVAVPGGKGRFILLPDEPRVVLAAEIETPIGELVVATTHLSFVPVWNLVQLRRATKQLDGIAAGRPCMLMGDINLPRSLTPVGRGWKRLGGRIATYPGGRPRMQIDQALGRGSLPAVRSAVVKELPLSDHRALVLNLADR